MVSSEEHPGKSTTASRRRTLIIGGTVAAAVALALVITLLPGMWDSSDPAPSSPPGEVEDEDRGGYIEIADPCGQMDLAGYQELLPIEVPAVEMQYEPRDQMEAAWQCKAEPRQDDDAEGFFLLTGHVHATQQDAEQEYQELLEAGESTWMDTEAAADATTVDGDWARGEHGYSETEEDGRSLQTIVQDDNLLLNIYFGLEGDPAAATSREDLAALENATVAEVMVQATA